MGGPRQADAEADTDAVGRQLSCCFHVDHSMRLRGADVLLVKVRACFVWAANGDRQNRFDALCGFWQAA